ncbi:MAG: hypothetical protein AAGA48_08520 [Myxococcota bacterium]
MIALLLAAPSLAQDGLHVHILIADVHDETLKKALEVVEPELASLVSVALREDPRVNLVSAPTFVTYHDDQAELRAGVGASSLAIDLVVSATDEGNDVELRVEERVPTDKVAFTTKKLLTHLVIPEGDVGVLVAGDRLVLVQIDPQVPLTTAQVMYERLLWHPRTARRVKRLDDLLGISE